MQGEFETLLQLSAERHTALENQYNLYVFEREAKDLQNWLLSRKTTAESDDFGQDLEGVEALQKKFEDFAEEVGNLGQSKLTTVQKLKQTVQSSEAQQKESDLLKLWEDLNIAMKARAENLRSAREVHQFDHDLDELRSWMNEKEVALDSEEQENDLLSVQALIRQHEGLERDLAVIEEDVSRRKQEGKALVSKCPRVRDSLSKRLQEVEEIWSSLLEKANQRRQRLQQAEAVQRYLTEWRELMGWLKETLSLVTGEGIGGEVKDLEQLIKRHEEYRTQIDRQLDKSEMVKNKGRRLMEEGNFMSHELKDRLAELQKLEVRVLEAWAERRAQYQDDLELQQLQRELEQAEHWLNTYESALRAEDYGDSVSDVLELMKKQEDLEAMIQAQSERFNALQARRIQREKKIKEIQSGDSTDSSRDKPIPVTSLKRKPSERPALPPHPLLTSPVLRNSECDNSSTPSRVPTATSAILQRSSSGKNDSSLVSRVASGLSSSDGDIVTAPDKPSTSVLDGPDSSSEISSAVFKHHYLHNAPKTDHTTSEDEVDTQRQIKPSLNVIAKPRITPRRLKQSTPDKEMLGPPTSKSPSKDEEMVDNQPSEDKNLPPSTPPEKPQSSPPASLSDPEEVQASPSTDSPTGTTVNTKIRAGRAITEGTLEIKLKQGGNKGLDHWETVYALLEEESLNLFKDQNAASANCTRWPPITLAGAVCKDNPYYRRKENTFKIMLCDGSHYLFAASSQEEQKKWLKELQNCTNPTVSSDSPGINTKASRESTEQCESVPGDTSDTQDSTTKSNQEKEDSTESYETERKPPPKPPHTYYNKHRYADGGESQDSVSVTQNVRSLQRNQPPSYAPPPPPQNQTENGAKDKSQNRSVFMTFFKK